MKKNLLLLIIILYPSLFQAQFNNGCLAFSEGCWSLIGASNGVELYVTHKQNARPNMADKGFNISVYSKIVNTNDYDVHSGLGVTTTFYYYNIDQKVMTPEAIIMDKFLGPRQTIVQYKEVFTNSPVISYSHIKSFIYSKQE